MSRGGSEEEPAALSPKNRLKLLCSYGGKILPRPSDGQLKYVGGETRILSVPRSVTFKELKERISGMFNNPEIVIKYQVFPEDIDTLVSVRSDEDLRHMLDEYDRHEGLPRSPSSSPRFRIFVFRSGIATSPSTSPTYIDAINGGSASGTKGGLSIHIRPPMFAISSSSVCSSPDSSPRNRAGPLGAAAKSGGRLGMARVHSTPNLGDWSSANGGGSIAGSPRGGRAGGGGGFLTPYHHPYHHHPQQQPPQPPPQHNGVMMGYGGGGGMGRMGCGAQRHDTCGGGYGCACAFSGHQNQMRYNYPPSPSSGGGSMWGAADDCQTSKSSSHSSFNFNGAGTPPIVPRKSIWE